MKPCMLSQAVLEPPVRSLSRDRRFAASSTVDNWRKMSVVAVVGEKMVGYETGRVRSCLFCSVAQS